MRNTISNKEKSYPIQKSRIITMEDWDNIMTTLMVLSGALIIGVNILIWKLGKFRKYDSRRFINYTSRGDGEGF